MKPNYLGQKGYSIYKKNLSIEQQNDLRRELMVQAKVPNSPVKTEPFPIYLESAEKIYVPRYFGYKKFGSCDIKIEDGEDIDLSFNGSLRDYQENIVNKFIKHITKNTFIGGGLIDVYAGAGKCMCKNTPIIMYDGSIKMVQDVKVGDQLMGDDSTPRNVLSLARGRETMYDIIPNKGDKYTVNESHILSLKSSFNHSKKYKKGEIYDISIKDYLNLPKSFHGPGGPLLGYRVGVDFPYTEVDIEPYFLGIWIGDGSKRNLGITNIDIPIIDYCYEYARRLELDIRKCDSNTTRCPSYFITSHNKKPNSLIESFHKYNLLNNKHIPHDFKCNSRQVRLELLAGIIDSDGSLNHENYDIIQKNKKLFDDIIYLARSLGFAAYKKECKKSCMYKGEKREGTYYRTTIHGKGLEEIPVKCERKKAKPRKQIKDALVSRIKVIKKEEDNYYGFELDGNHRYLLGDFTVTHNTVMGIKLITLIKKKTLIIVHKGFLSDQWIERIKEFCPDAKIGLIQGQIIDIENKDIVIGMLQSLSMKEYPQDLFKSFGFLILDEVHHISSETFSRAMQKIVTKHSLGLSATMNRKDGLSFVFKMFLGDVVHKEKRDDGTQVLVKAIKYNNPDPEYNEVEYDFRGNVKFSTMISKVGEYNNRSEFILSVIKNELEKNPNQQILFLAHRKSLLTYMFKAIEHRNIASVGFYIGGMKERDLKESENKTIILATFQMAEEGLDIKTLSSLVLATPKTDIVQAVGRILRIKHEAPLIIDIVDSHEIFEKQFNKRRAFYIKNKYKIIQTDNEKYFENKYDINFDPSVQEVKKNKENKCLIKL
jgi:superfamily II DNA or RNA helicase